MPDPDEAEILRDIRKERLAMTTAADILRVAASQNGYVETGANQNK